MLGLMVGLILIPRTQTTATRIIDATTPNVIAFDAQSNYGINELDAITSGADTPINPLDTGTTHALTTQFLSPVQNGTTHQINTTWVNQINGGYGTFVNGNVYAVVINDSQSIIQRYQQYCTTVQSFRSCNQ